MPFINQSRSNKIQVISHGINKKLEGNGVGYPEQSEGYLKIDDFSGTVIILDDE